MKATELLVLARRDLCVVRSHQRAAGRANRLPGPENSISELGLSDNEGWTLRKLRWSQGNNTIGHSDVLVIIV